jgi:hypothetical protein
MHVVCIEQQNALDFGIRDTHDCCKGIASILIALDFHINHSPAVQFLITVGFELVPDISPIIGVEEVELCIVGLELHVLPVPDCKKLS